MLFRFFGIVLAYRKTSSSKLYPKPRKMYLTQIMRMSTFQSWGRPLKPARCISSFHFLFKSIKFNFYEKSRIVMENLCGKNYMQRALTFVPCSLADMMHLPAVSGKHPPKPSLSLPLALETGLSRIKIILR